MTSRNLAGTVGMCAVVWLTGCGDNTTAPDPVATTTTPRIAAASAETAALAAEVRQLAATRGVTPVPARTPVRPALSQLGRMLAFDKVLSGNRDISCMTCHLAKAATIDQRSVAVGQGATGLGTARVHPLGKFVHRNAPSLFNTHAMDKLTWDGRVFKTAGGVIRVPGAQLTASQRSVLECGAVSALPMFPVLSRAEMRADGGNELANIADTLPQKIWKLAMARLAAVPEYRPLFEAAYPGVSFDNMNFAHAGNAMGCWITAVFTATNTPWDNFLAGNDNALTDQQLRGAKAFLGDAKCGQCHNGPLFSDGKFHNVAVPQVGPGFGDGVNGKDDFGRIRETKKPEDKYKFRTPPLRNVELTAPYGHDGAIVDLHSWVDHYVQSDVKLRNYDPNQLEPLLRATLQPTASDILLTRDAKLKKMPVTPVMVDDITEFLKALTDPASRNLGSLVPAAVPSGLPVDGAP